MQTPARKNRIGRRKHNNSNATTSRRLPDAPNLFSPSQLCARLRYGDAAQRRGLCKLA
jgi:hypothetical protein